MIDLSPIHLKIVKDILHKNLPNREVIVFGSRVTGKTKKHSDLDICVMGTKPLTLKEFSDLREDFSESDLPMRVDIVDWATTSEEFRQIIKKQGEHICL